MASANEDTLGDEIQNIGKVLNVSALVSEIASKIIGIKEKLESTRNDSQKFLFQDPEDKSTVLPAYLRQFRRTLDRCSDLTEALSSLAKNSSKKHSECVETLKNIADSTELTTQRVDAIHNNLNELAQQCVEFGNELYEFLECLQEAKDLAEITCNESKREEEKLQRRASDIRLEAHLKSVSLWAGRIATLGLIELNSNFRNADAANKAKHNEASRLKALAEEFHESRDGLDRAIKSFDSMRLRVQGGPIKLTTEMLGIVQNSVKSYERWKKMKQELLEKDKTIEEQSAQIAQLQEQLKRKKINT